MWKIKDVDVPVLTQDLVKDNFFNIEYRSHAISDMFREEYMFEELGELKEDTSEMSMSTIGYNTITDKFQVSFTEESTEKVVIIGFRVTNDEEVVDVEEQEDFNSDIILLTLDHEP